MIKQLLKYCLNLLFPKKKELLLNEITVNPLKKIKDKYTMMLIFK